MNSGRVTQVLAKLASSLAAVALCAVTAGALAQTTTPQRIEQVQVTSTDTDLPPGERAQWLDDKVPWFRGFAQVDTVPDYLWFRFTLPEASTTQALFVSRHTLNLAVYINGRKLLDERRNPDYSGWNTPLLLELQPATLGSTRNEVLLGLRKSVGTTYLNPIIVGALEQVQPLYRSAYFAQVQIPQAVLMACGLLAALSFGIWSTRRQHREYLYYGGACLSWGVVMLYMLRPTPLWLGLWHWMVLDYLAIELAALSMVAFLCHTMGFRARHWLWGGLWLALVSSAMAVVLPPRFGIPLSLSVQATAVAALVVTAWHIFRRVLRPPRGEGPDTRRKTLWLAVGLATLLVFPLFDLFYYLDAQWHSSGFEGTTLSQFSFPASLGILFVHLVHQLWSALDHSDNLRRELVQRVQQATSELEQHLQERHQLELQHSVRQERLKIYRDLHDDVGAKLTTILHSSDDSRQKQMARSALESLRETIHRANYREQSLEQWLEGVTEEMQLRLQAAGLRFDSLTGALPSRLLDAGESYHLTRALRELCNNILHHARASQVLLKAAGSAEDKVVIELSDDGCGFTPGAARGNGVTNIRQRLQELGGSAQWFSQPEAGCRVRLEF